MEKETEEIMKRQTPGPRSRLEVLTFGSFNVRTAAVKALHGIGHIDVFLRPCAANGCDIIQRDGTSEIVAAGYRVYFSGDCSEEKGNTGLDWQ